MKKLLIFISIAYLLVACQNKNQKDSAFFRGNGAHTGVFETKGVAQLHGVKWTFKTKGRVFSSPIYFDNIIYIGSDDNYFYALSASDGKLIWKFKTGGRVSSSTAIYKDNIYFLSFDGNLYCLERVTGKEIWKFKTAGEKVFAAPGIHGMPEKDRALDDPWDMFLSSPVVANGKVYVGCGESTFYAIDCQTGKEVWNFKTGGVVHSSPAYSDSTIFFGSWDSYLYALNAENGTLKWKFKTGIDTVYYNQVGFQSSPAIYKGVVYSGCRDANIWAVDAKTGTLKWKFSNNGSWVINSPAITNDTLYFATSDTHKFIALNALDGKQLFTGDCKSFGFSSAAIAQGMVYLGHFAGGLIAFDAKNGTTLWEFKTESAKTNKDSIIKSNGEFDFSKIFKENTYQANLKAMDVLYSVGSILSSPCVENEVIYIGSTDGNVYALY